jgi:hypothetical protein
MANRNSLFTYPVTAKHDFVFFRFRGPGLGNILFPWARSVVAARKLGILPIFPCWPQIRLRALARFRWKYDARTYARIFHNPGTYLAGWRKLRILAPPLPFFEEAVLDRGEAKLPAKGIIVFREMDKLFAPILKDHELVRDELISITRPEHLKGLMAGNQRAITVHVRLGDFDDTKGEAGLRRGAFGTRSPVDWYKHAIEAVRGVLGNDTPVRIFSDGKNGELSQLLAIQGARRCSFGSSIADLLALSTSRVLIASGGSTFSMWASYLGRMPVIWYPGQLRPVYYNFPEAELELECGAKLPAPFSEVLRLPRALNPMS